jgi:hypothetical protein
MLIIRPPATKEVEKSVYEIIEMFLKYVAVCYSTTCTPLDNIEDSKLSFVICGLLYNVEYFYLQIIRQLIYTFIPEERNVKLVDFIINGGYRGRIDEIPNISNFGWNDLIFVISHNATSLKVGVCLSSEYNSLVRVHGHSVDVRVVLHTPLLRTGNITEHAFIEFRNDAYLPSLLFPNNILTFSWFRKYNEYEMYMISMCNFPIKFNKNSKIVIPLDKKMLEHVLERPEIIFWHTVVSGYEGPRHVLCTITREILEKVRNIEEEEVRNYFKFFNLNYQIRLKPLHGDVICYILTDKYNLRDW